ncbi:MAG: hypothetical protein P8Z40_11180 [Chloroflexota bacterium]
MSSRSLFLAAAALILGALACNAPGGEPAGGAPDVTVTPTPLPPTPTTTPPTATPQPEPPQPTFSGPIRFTTDPNGNTSQQAFPAGVEEIWAEWDYAGMSEGDLIRRVWYQDGTVWIEREEAWDMGKYGASGTVRDISIYDYGGGLPPGEYSLELFINGTQQDVDPATFSITGGETTGGTDAIAYPSPDRSRTAIIQQLGTLVLTQIDGSSRTLAEHGEIIDVEWFPDNETLLYVTLDRGDTPEGDQRGERRQLVDQPERRHAARPGHLAGRQRDRGGRRDGLRGRGYSGHIARLHLPGHQPAAQRAGDRQHVQRHPGGLGGQRVPGGRGRPGAARRMGQHHRVPREHGDDLAGG